MSRLRYGYPENEIAKELADVVTSNSFSAEQEELIGRLIKHFDSQVGSVKDLQNVQNLRDISVNRAKVNLDEDSNAVLQTDPISNPSGTFNGGGTGNKPILGIPGFEDRALKNFPFINTGNVELREGSLGLSFNALIDLNGDGSNVVVMVITETLKEGQDGSYSVDTFDIMDDVFYIVGNPPNYTGSEGWFANEVTYDNLVNGDGSDYDGGFPDAQLIPEAQIHSDGGLPAGIKMPAVWAQIGGSSNESRTVTDVDSIKMDGKEILIKLDK